MEMKLDADRFLADIRRLDQPLMDAARVGARAEAELILTDARADVPVETGALRDSGKVIETSTGFEVVFSAPYALYVHENLEKKHAQGSAKFLEKAALRGTPGRADRIASRMKGAR